MVEYGTARQPVWCPSSWSGRLQESMSEWVFMGQIATLTNRLRLPVTRSQTVRLKSRPPSPRLDPAREAEGADLQILQANLCHAGEHAAHRGLTGQRVRARRLVTPCGFRQGCAVANPSLYRKANMLARGAFQTGVPLWHRLTRKPRGKKT